MQVGLTDHFQVSIQYCDCFKGEKRNRTKMRRTVNEKLSFNDVAANYYYFACILFV